MISRRTLVLALLAAPAAYAQPANLLGSLTQTDARRGVKEALALAAQNATTRLGQPDGFYGAPRVRIPLPGLLGSAQRNLSRIGMSAPLDDLQARLNHGAEESMPQAARLFADAVRSITLDDAIQIVRGGDDSATQFLRGRTETRLTTLLRPRMNTALTQSGAFVALRRASSQLPLGGETTGMQSQITDFATAKALDGAFLYIADEERSIRRDPVRRGSDILRRVFG